ncbi:MAG: hypothetical protein ACR2HG_15455 [Pyrinomonadaceae bacterium]
MQQIFQREFGGRTVDAADRKFYHSNSRLSSEIGRRVRAKTGRDSLLLESAEMR